MTKLELMQVANKGYPDGALSEHYDDNGNFVASSMSGDGLAAYVVAELSDVYDKDESTKRQLQFALRAMRRSVRDLEDVIVALEEEEQRHGHS